MQSTEFIKFSLIHMPCCGQMLCWVNPRLPNYCPECGKLVWIHQHPETIMHSDDKASLRVHFPDTPVDQYGQSRERQGANR